MKKLTLVAVLFGWALPGAPLSGIASISVHPPQATISGQSRQTLLVTAHYAGGREEDVTSRTRFRVLSPGVLEVGADGVAKALQEGKTAIEATYENRRATAEVTVADLAPKPLTFVRAISPIMTQKGCNGSNCHGSIRGKAGFKLSLFGGRPDLDYEALIRADAGRRINLTNPGESLLLKKPAFQVPHGGGLRFKPDSLEYRAIVEWIKSGTIYNSDRPQLTGLEVYPSERILVGVGASQRLVVTGKYSDGSRSDLTPVVQYTSNNEGIAVVSDAGEVKTKRAGETAIMVRTLGKAAVASILVIKEAPGAEYPTVSTNNFVDELVFAKLRKLNIVPSKLSGDSEFLRRIYLDAIGTLPTIQETRAFLASTDPRKRETLIDDLLKRPEFVDLWALKMADLFQLGNSTGVKGGWQLYRWLHSNLKQNAPYDGIVRDLLLSGGPFVFESKPNFYNGLWVGPEGMVTQISQGLLGIRMDCAKCHDHPFERWTQDDFYGMAAFFTRLEFKAESYGLFERAIGTRPNHKPTYDYVSTGKELMHPKTKEPLKPRFLGGATVDLPPGEDVREKLADWLTSPRNPWFATATANRIWKHYMGRGLVEPVDDFRVTNPPSNPRLLAALGSYLAEEKFDLRQLMRVILKSRTYQLSSAPATSNESDDLNYSRFYLKRQTAESLMDAMSAAAESRIKIPGHPPGTRALTVAVGAPNYFLMTFGRMQSRDQICERDHEANVSQAMHLINGDTVNDSIKAPSNIVERVLGHPDWPEERRIEEIYLAALSRRPTGEELSKFRAQAVSIDDTESRKKLYQDLLWAILNSKEFAYIY